MSELLSLYLLCYHLQGGCANPATSLCVGQPKLAIFRARYGTMNETGTASDLQPFKRPRARDWFWRPWYAKLWWSLIIFALVLGWTLPRDVLLAHEGAMWFIMVSVLNPYLVILGLGFGYFRAAWRYRYGPMVAVSEEEFPEGNRGGYGLRRGSNPTDPSDTYWHWHPANPRSLYQYKQRLDRILRKP
ncbi:hypothetical protein BSY17_26 [Sphingobium sp. RAC03]|nr:hypothetical protein BSY17_26 [Sphingobium sp. RAC03]